MEEGVSKILIETKSSEKEIIALHKNLKRFVSVFGGSLTTNCKRGCDNCNKLMNKGDKYEGDGMEEFCEKCATKNKIKGKWKTNKYEAR